MTIAALDIRALTPQSLPDFLDLFDRRAFADNPRWQSCYCHFPHADHARIVWKERSLEQNRAATCERIEHGTMQGWLAYMNGEPAGWCNAGARRFIEGLFDEPEPLADRIGAISCFVVVPAHRQQGVASALLQAACDGLLQQGFEWAEAYPRSAASNPADNHYGPLSMFSAAGFEVVSHEEDDGVKVRKRLCAPTPS